NYLFFLVHLELKDKTEYTSHETFISESLVKNDLSFFPINRAIALKNWESDASATLETTLTATATVGATTSSVAVVSAAAENKEFAERISGLEMSIRAIAEGMEGMRVHLSQKGEGNSNIIGDRKKRSSKFGLASTAVMAAGKFKKGTQ
ncbi:hypothetical protein HK100_007616, partial [Physocladia obscura]